MATYICAKCNGDIELTKEMKKPGTQLICPHCETPIVIPRKIKEEDEQIENSIDTLGSIIFVLSIIGAIITFGIAAMSLGSDDGNPAIFFAAAMAVFAQGLIWKILLRGFAEIIRLLRKISEKG